MKVKKYPRKKSSQFLKFATIKRAKKSKKDKEGRINQKEDSFNDWIRQEREELL